MTKKMINKIVTLLNLFILILSCSCGPNRNTKVEVTSTTKVIFFEMFNNLETSGDTFTKDSVTKAEAYLPYMVSMSGNEFKDKANNDLFRLISLCSSLSVKNNVQQYIITHFRDIKWDKLKMIWSICLFNCDNRSPVIMKYLTNAIKQPINRSFIKAML